MTATGSRGARPNEDTARLWDSARGRVHRPHAWDTDRTRKVGAGGGIPPPAAWKPTVETQALRQASAPGVQAGLRSPRLWHPHEAGPKLSLHRLPANCSLVTRKSSPSYKPDPQALRIEQLEQAVPEHCSGFNSL